MRGKHKHYIELVNNHTLPWYEKKGKKVITTRPLTFSVKGDLYIVPEGIETDLFSCVPDTGYTRFHRAALLHDVLRGDPEVSRRVADYCFMIEMVDAIEDIGYSLRITDCPEKVVDREMVRLCRISSLYMIGVSGLIGSIYLKLDKIF